MPDEHLTSSSPNLDESKTDMFANNDDSDDENEEENDNMENPVDLKMLFKSVLKVNT